jgi:hypothetical protein
LTNYSVSPPMFWSRVASLLAYNKETRYRCNELNMEIAFLAESSF